MNRRAFTLIELLAVIVILAIIALIAVPIVLHIIEDSKKSSKEESIKMYAKAIEDGVANFLLRNSNQKEVPTIQELQQGHYINYKGNVSCEEEEIYPNGKIYLDKCTVDGTKVLYTYGEKQKKSYKKYITLVTDIGTSGLSPGDEYTYEVMDNMTEPYTFYVLSVEGDKVNLIMDRNICANGEPATSGNLCLIAWYDAEMNNSYGPITAMEGLYNATKDWTNVPDMNLDYTDEGHIANSSYGYGKIETTATGIKITKKDGTTEVTRSGNLTPVIPYETNKTLKARLPKLEEVYNTDTNDTTHCHVSDGDCPAWLTNGLNQYSSYYSNNDHISGIYGYWTLSSRPGGSFSAHYVRFRGGVDYSVTSSAGYYGLRAVITVLKSDLS